MVSSPLVRSFRSLFTRCDLHLSNGDGSDTLSHFIDRRRALDELGDFTDGDRPSFVSKCETAELRIVGETLHAHGCRGLDQGNNFLAPFGKLWRLLGFAASSLVKVVKKCL
jgi:hypothetical protein